MKGFQFRAIGIFLFLTSLIVTSCFEQNDDTSSRLPDTGQVTAYTDSFGEDSDYTINPPSYTKLDEHGDDLPDSVASWAMIRDNVTGLVWENKTDDGTIHDKDNTYAWYDPNDETNGGDPGDPGDGANTRAFIEALNAANFGGYHDWRLPTVQELSLIVNADIPYPGPAINTDYFPNTASGYWSSTNTPFTNTPYDAVLGVDFKYGSVSYCYKNFRYAVRAVRGSAAQGELVDNGDGTVTDEKTGLMWQQGEAGKMHWEEALAYCENLILPEGGYDDWRLPNRNELQSLVDYSRRYPAIDQTYFPGCESYFYWSSTTDASYTTYTLGVDFTSGYVSDYSKVGSRYVRAVRSIKAIPQELRAPSHVKGGYQPENSWNFITWDSVPGAVKYKVYGGTKPGVKKTGKCLTVTDTTNYSHTGVLLGCSYYYRVSAVDADGNESKLSEQVVSYVHLGPATVKIPDTGQAASYTDIFGEDSDYTINPPSYTRLDENGGDLPDSAASWSMIRDNVTGLVWENKTDDGTIHDKDNTYAWCDSNAATNGDDPNTQDFIEALNAARFGGYHDWRLPTVQELSWILHSDIPYPGPAINTTYFPNIEPVDSWYWSSTNVTDDHAWGVEFKFGVLFGWLNKDSRCAVRAVRGSTAQRELVDNGDGTVTDTATGLMWQQTEAGEMPWEEAMAYCENLVLPEGGYDDWRLPNRNELRSLVDYSREDPAIDLTHFPGVVSSDYWSSTTRADFMGRAWTVSFYYGDVNNYYKSYSNYVLAVRGGE